MPGQDRWGAVVYRELTKSVVESATSQSRLQALAIPATLQEALLARLDRLASARQVAQLGATVGREFSRELLQAIIPLNTLALETALNELVEAEILYQRGIGEQTRYFFKHALIQDTAYQSLLKSTRQQYHQQIAQVLEERFPATKETQPELLAHHFTEASLIEQAIPYWLQAGQRSTQRSANVEAIAHLTTGLDLLKPLPATPEHAQQELTLQVALGTSLMATKGQASPEVGIAYGRAKELCEQLGEETPQFSLVLLGLCNFYMLQGELQEALKLGEQLLNLAQSTKDQALLAVAYRALGVPLAQLGEFAHAREHFEQGIALYNLRQYRSPALRYGGYDPVMACLCWAAWALWHLGHPDQALQRIHEALTLAQELSSPPNLVATLSITNMVHTCRRDVQRVQQQAEAGITLATDHGFLYWRAIETMLRGWALTEQGHDGEGMTQLYQGLATYRTTGSAGAQPYFLALVAEACLKTGQAAEGLNRVAEALLLVNKTGERQYEAELYRLKGQLTLQSTVARPESQVEEEVQEYFRKAIEIARKQQAKSLELRAATSLARLWQDSRQAERSAPLLSKIYGWFTEGFDTKDLQRRKRC